MPDVESIGFVVLKVMKKGFVIFGFAFRALPWELCKLLCATQLYLFNYTKPTSGNNRKVVFYYSIQWIMRDCESTVHTESGINSKSRAAESKIGVSKRGSQLVAESVLLLSKTKC